MKKISYWLLLISFLNQLLWPIGILAQEITPEPTPTETVEVIDPTTTPTETPIDTEITPTPTEIPEPTPTIGIEPTVTPEASDEADLLITPPEDETVIIIVPDAVTAIDINNQAQVDNSSDSQANSGNNTNSSDQENVVNKTVTGDATAYANLVNLLNTNSVDSNVKIMVMNPVSGVVENIDLNSAWQLLSGDSSVLSVDMTSGQYNWVRINNTASVDNQVTVVANSGGNFSTGDLNYIRTGNSTALANVVNLMNINAIGSNVFLGVLNLYGSNLGNLILPNPERFLAASNNGGTVDGWINNQANITTNSLSTSNTGENNINGGGLVNTGDAWSSNQVVTSANLNFINAMRMTLAINSLGNWTGSIINGYGAGSVVNPGLYNWFEFGTGIANGNNNWNVGIDNTAIINNQVNVLANSGQNTIDGNGRISTGNSYSLANVFNMANINLINSNWFYGVINIIGDWNGNAEFAYPDMEVTASISQSQVRYGDNVGVRINYKNIGLDQADGVKLTVTLPDGVQYTGDDSGASHLTSGRVLTWNLGDIVSGRNGSFNIETKFSNDMAGIIHPAIASDDFNKTINADIVTINTESNLNNNHTAVTGTINENQGEITSEQPVLRIEASNNVNDWVYEGDVVTFEVKGRNEGNVSAHDTYMIHRVYDENNNLLSENRINIGEAGANKQGKVTFGIPLNFDLKKTQTLHSTTVWSGKAPNDNDVNSNESSTSFIVKYRGITANHKLVGNVQAVNWDNSEILGQMNNVCQPLIDVLPYFLLFVISGAWILRQSKRWIKK